MAATTAHNTGKHGARISGKADVNRFLTKHNVLAPCRAQAVKIVIVIHSFLIVSFAKACATAGARQTLGAIAVPTAAFISTQ
jgi:hypothetical protein